MLKIPETQVDFLNDMINHFNLNNRGVLEDVSLGYTTCSYVAGCAIGRYLNLELCKKLDNLSFHNGSSVSNTDVFSLLPDEMKSLGSVFLERVQNLHDAHDNWNDDGLTEQGIIMLKNIIDNCTFNDNPVIYKGFKI